MGQRTSCCIFLRLLIFLLPLLSLLHLMSVLRVLSLIFLVPILPVLEGRELGRPRLPGGGLSSRNIR